MFKFDNTSAIERRQPMAIAIRKAGKMYEIRDSITFRPMQVWLVVGCPDGDVFFAPESSYERHSKGTVSVKPKNRMLKHGPRDHFGVAADRELYEHIVERIRGMFDDEN